MKVFISYASEDKSVAHLLAYVLEKSGNFTCEYDCDLEAGRNFDKQLQKMIRESHLVLVLLTKSSLNSPWVNQEIGFATALDKFVYPLAIESVDPLGMIQMCHKYSLFDWSDSRATIQKLMRELRFKAAKKIYASSQSQLDFNLRDTYERTDFLIARLGKVVSERTGRIIRQQAAFSIFAVSGDRAFRKAGQHSAQYLRLLMEERAITHKLVRAPANEYRLILWPVRHWNREYQKLRFGNLTQWLSEIKDVENIDVRCGEFAAPSNRLIVSNEFVLDGTRPQMSAGFGYSKARFKQERIEQASQEFDALWNTIEHDKAEAIRRLIVMSEEYESGGVATPELELAS